MKQMQQYLLAYRSQSEHSVKNHYMSVNSSPTAWQQNMKNLAVSNFLTVIAGVVDNGDLFTFTFEYLRKI